MAIYNREEEYVKLLTERTYTVKELAQKLFVSEPTVRRDILLLKKKELVTCVNVNIAFFSCRGLSTDGMASDNSIPENNIRRIMIRQAKRKILLCDSSKFNRTYLNTLCHANELDAIVCEKELPKAIIERLK
ncbi:MAG: DeoR family transcriptional regulator [Clostridia bacterium]|nr:DeoR family transcriptional regulator [Clostridia bacterium]